MKIKMPQAIVEKLGAALKKAGKSEIGGILMGEHIGENEFRVVEITIQRMHGSIVSFTRLVDYFLQPLKAFFRKTSFAYSKFNYLGEWHSHPSFEPVPSHQDLLSMMEIVCDKDVGANFAILMIVKLDSSERILLSGSVFFPTGAIQEALVESE